MASNGIPIPHGLLYQRPNLLPSRLALMRPDSSSRKENLPIGSVPDFELEKVRRFERDLDRVEQRIGGAFVQSFSESVRDNESDFCEFRFWSIFATAR